MIESPQLLQKKVQPFEEALQKMSFKSADDTVPVTENNLNTTTADSLLEGTKDDTSTLTPASNFTLERIRHSSTLPATSSDKERMIKVTLVEKKEPL